jgi:thiol-disulfide isomerase/thioredoxin
MDMRYSTSKRLMTFAFIIMYFILSILILGILAPKQATASDEHPILYLFWGEGCPHCEKEKEFLKKLQAKYPQLEMRWFEVWKHPEFTKLADAMRQAYEVKTSSVPITFVGKWTHTGFLSDKETGAQIENQVVACIQQGCIDPLETVGPRQVVLTIRNQTAQNAPVGWELFPATAPQPKPNPSQSGNTQQTETSIQQTSSQISNNSSSTSESNPHGAESVSTWFGVINVSQTGLPLFTVIIAGLDGFNPCAMWVLCFLLTLVIYANSRAKILLIGGIFVIASGVIYFLFMTAWLNIFLLVGYVKLLRIAVALVAIVMGLINCKDFFFFKKGFSLTIPESAQPGLFKKMRELVQTSAIPAVILGTIVLAVTANLIELLCTAGFPAIYTRILTLQEDLPVFQYYLYLVFYNIVYVVPLAAIVGVFAWKMGGRKLTEKEGRILKLVGGVLMLALGIILLAKPELLMFG